MAKVYKLDKRTIRGAGCYYPPRGWLGKAICKFSKNFSHVSTILNSKYEYDSAVEHKGVSINEINYERKPVIVRNGFEGLAFNETRKVYDGMEYGELQVITKVVVEIFNNEALLFDKYSDCSEVRGYYLYLRKMYTRLTNWLNNGTKKKIRKKQWVSKKIQSQMSNPSILSPWKTYVVDRAINRTFYRHYPIVKVVKVVGDDIYVREYDN